LVLTDVYKLTRFKVLYITVQYFAGDNKVSNPSQDPVNVRTLKIYYSLGAQLCKIMAQYFITYGLKQVAS
jgi:hypothetical protein